MCVVCVCVLLLRVCAVETLSLTASKHCDSMHTTQPFCTPHPLHFTQAKAKLTDLQRENGILKKAVQIQNTKLTERAGQEQELQQLRHLLSQYQEQVREQRGNCAVCFTISCASLCVLHETKQGIQCSLPPCRLQC